MSAATLLLATALMSNRSALINSFSPASLFTSGEQGIWLDPSDFSTMFQDAYAQVPVAAFGQAVSWGFDKSQGLALGSELRQTGVIGIFGTATPATYNSTTGAGTFSRVDIANQSFVEWTGLFNTIYKVDVQNTGTFAFSVRTNNASEVVAVINPGQRVTVNIPVQLGGISLRGNNGESCGFTLHSLKQLLGNHARQLTSASRPILGRNPAGGARNLLTYTEDLANAAWVKGNTAPGTLPTVTNNFGVAPDGSNTAARVQLNGGAASGGGNSQIASPQIAIPSGQTDTMASVWLRSLAGDVAVSLYSTGAVIGITVTAEWQKFTYPRTGVTSGNHEFRLAKRDIWGTPGAADLLVWHPQVEFGSVATSYQRVGVGLWDVTEQGQPDCYYLAFDGVDDFLVTGTIIPGTDKAQVFAGLRKLSETGTTSVIMESSADSSANSGTVALFASVAPPGSNYGFRTKGDAAIGALTTPATYPAPTTNVVVGLGDVSGDSISIRVNATTVLSGTTEQGAGGFTAQPMFIGRRNGAGLPFNGRIYSLINRFGPNLSATQIAQTEAWVNSKTRAY